MITPATYEAEGLMGNYCTGCDDLLSTSTIEKLMCEHDWVMVETIAPTCMEDGFTTYACSICEETKNNDFTAALNHDFIEIGKPGPFCGMFSYIDLKCIRCGELGFVIIQPREHNWFMEDIIAPACEATGYYVYRCSYCGERENRNEVDALGHDWDSGTIISPPTYEAEGEALYACLRTGCDKTERRAIPKLKASIVFKSASGTLTRSEVSAQLTEAGVGLDFSATFDSSVIKIDDIAFLYSTGITSVIIPDHVTSIGHNAFMGSTMLRSINIPSSVTNIGNNAFSDCISLIQIDVDQYNTMFLSIDGVLFDKTAKTLIQYPSGKSGAYTIPDGVTCIENAAFRRRLTTTALQRDKQTITITHPFSPQKGQEYIFVDMIHAWGEDKIICCDEHGNSRSILASWTDYSTDDSYRTIENPINSIDFRFDDLQMLAKLIADIKTM